MRLDGKVAVITGGGSGFGQSAAVRFAEEGARIVVVDWDRVGAEATAKLVADAGFGAELVIGDVAAANVATEAVERAIACFGGLDVLVNNAGIVRGAADTWEADDEVWDLVLSVNLRSVFVCTRAAVPQMIERGGGSVVNTASIAASCCVGGTAYAAAKGGMIS